MPAYLEKRGRTYYVRVKVPLDLQGRLKKQKIIRSLKTRDYRQALAMRMEAVAAVHTEFAKLRRTPLAPQTVDPAEWGPLAVELAAGVQAADDTDRLDADYVPLPSERLSLEVAAEAHADKLFGLYAYDDPDHPNHDARRLFGAIAIGKVLPLSIAFQDWLDDEGNERQWRQKTRDRAQFIVDQIEEYGGKLFPVQHVNRPWVARFIRDKLAGRAKKTQSTLISPLAGLWDWLERRGLIPPGDNPWRRQVRVPKRRATAQGDDDAFALPPFSDEQLVMLLSADWLATMPRSTVFPAVVRDLIPWGLLTGMRLEEMCATMAANVDPAARTVFIPGGKTRNARRLIPVHPLAWPIVERRLKAADGGPLFPELVPGGADNIRSHKVPTRFRTMLNKAMPGMPKGTGMHTLRRTFGNFCFRLYAVPGVTMTEHMRRELMGHDKELGTGRQYVSGFTLDQKRAAIGELDRVVPLVVLKALELVR